MTAEIDELLASAFTLDNLQVYADHLQLQGDPRGELVAIDLHLARDGSSPELLHRKRNRLRAWLGLDPAEDPTRGAWAQVQFAFGFVEDVRAEQLRRVLDSPAAPFVRGVTLTGKTPIVEWGLAGLALAERPWLHRLTIAPRFRGDPPELWTRSANAKLTNLSNTAIPGLIAMTPRLADLRLAGHRLIRSIPHPSVRRLQIDGIDALQAILVAHAPMPAVTELVLAFAHEPGARIAIERPPPPLLPPESFPALRRLDLSPNEDHRAITDTQVDVFDTLARTEILPQLEELRVPSVRNENEAVQLQRAVDRMPALRRLEIARACAVPISTRAERVIDDLPWPRHEWAQGTISIQFRRARRPHLLEMRDAVRQCEIRYRDFDPETRRVWTELWQVVLRDVPDSFSIRTLVVALDAFGYIEANRSGMKPWWLLRETARDADPDDEVVISRAR